MKVIIKRVKWVLPIYSLNTHQKGGREKAEQTGIMYHLHGKHVVVPADKTPNKIVFMCNVSLCLSSTESSLPHVRPLLPKA